MRKRSEFTIGKNVKEGDATDIHQAYIDLCAILKNVTEDVHSPNINLNTFDRYFNHFDPKYISRVQGLFRTVLQMALDGVNVQGTTSLGKRPRDLNEITILRSKSWNTYLAEAQNVDPDNLDATITIYDFGWDALHQRTLQQLTCADIGPKTNYKMHVLGSLLLHEIL